MWAPAASNGNIEEGVVQQQHKTACRKPAGGNKDSRHLAEWLAAAASCLWLKSGGKCPLQAPRAVFQ